MRNSRSTCTSEGDFIFYSSVIFHAASLQRSDFPFQLSVFRFEFTNGCFICANLTFCGSKPSIESSISIRTSRFLRRDLCLKLRLCVCNRCIAIRNFLRNGSIDCLISSGGFSVDGRVDSRSTIISFLPNSVSNCIISRIFFSRNLAINFGLIIVVFEFVIYVSTCLCEFLIHISSISFGFQRSRVRFCIELRLCRKRSIRVCLGIHIRLIRLAVQLRRVRFICQFVVHICRIRFAIHNSFKIIQRVFCSIRFTSKGFIQFIVFQFGDVTFIRSDVRCILSNIGLIGFQIQFCICQFP